MIKVYPDRRWPAFLRVLADTVTVGWTIVWAYLGFLIYQTVMGLKLSPTELPTRERPSIRGSRHSGMPCRAEFRF